MPGGRPTSDPKGKLVAVRLASRQIQALEARARREGTGISEALRRCLEEWMTSSPGPQSPSPKGRPPTAEERKSFDQVFAALGLSPRRTIRKPKSR